MLVITAADLSAFRQGKITARRGQSPDQRSAVLIYNRPAMLRRPLVAVAALVALMLAPAACGPDIDLSKSLTITDVISGYYDNGSEGRLEPPHAQPHVPGRQLGAASLTGVELTVAFWQDGEDGEMDSVLVQRIGDDTIPANGTTDPVTVRGDRRLSRSKKPAPTCSPIACSRTSRRRSSRAAAAASIPSAA